MIGVSDVEFMDYDTAYYTTDSLFDRMTLRSLYNWPAVAGPRTCSPPRTLPPPCRQSPMAASR